MIHQSPNSLCLYITHFFVSSTPSQTIAAFCYYRVVCILKAFYIGGIIHYMSYLLGLFSYTQHNYLWLIHVDVCIKTRFLYWRVILHWMDMPYFVYAFWVPCTVYYKVFPPQLMGIQTAPRPAWNPGINPTCSFVVVHYLASGTHCNQYSTEDVRGTLQIF